MRFRLLALTIASLNAQIPGEAEKAAQAVKILDSWHAKAPKKETRNLHFVLWTPKGRKPPENYEARLTRMMEHIQEFYAKEMKRLGFGPRSINLPYSKPGQLKNPPHRGEASYFSLRKTVGRGNPQGMPPCSQQGRNRC